MCTRPGMNPTPHHGKAARRLPAWHFRQQGWPQRHIAEALGGQRRRGQPGLAARPPGCPPGLAPSALAWRTPPVGVRAADAVARPAAPWPRSRWRPRVDSDARGRGDPCGVGHTRSPRACRSTPHRAPLASSTAQAPRPPARRGGDRARAPRDVAGPQQGAPAPPQTLLVRDDSGFSPLPSMVCTAAPQGPTPGRRAWWTRAPLSAISAISPAGTWYCRSQDQALNSEDVVALLAPWRREVSGRLGRIGAGAPIHRRPTMPEVLATGVAPRLPRERRPA